MTDILKGEEKILPFQISSVFVLSELVLKALEVAVGRRQVALGLIFHRDRGSQYASGTG